MQILPSPNPFTPGFDRAGNRERLGRNHSTFAMREWVKKKGWVQNVKSERERERHLRLQGKGENCNSLELKKRRQRWITHVGGRQSDKGAEASLSCLSVHVGTERLPELGADFFFPTIINDRVRSLCVWRRAEQGASFGEHREPFSVSKSIKPPTAFRLFWELIYSLGLLSFLWI